MSLERPDLEQHAAWKAPDARPSVPRKWEPLPDRPQPSLPDVSADASSVAVDGISPVFVVPAYRPDAPVPEHDVEPDADADEDEPKGSSPIRWLAESPRLSKFLRVLTGALTFGGSMKGVAMGVEAGDQYHHSELAVERAKESIGDFGYEAIHPVLDGDKLNVRNADGTVEAMSRAEYEIKINTMMSDFLATRVDLAGGNSLKDVVDKNALVESRIPVQFVFDGLEKASQDYEASHEVLVGYFGPEAEEFSRNELLAHKDARMGDSEAKTFAVAIKDTFGDRADDVAKELADSGATPESIWKDCQDFERAAGAKREFEAYRLAGQDANKTVKGYDAGAVVDFYGYAGKFDSASFQMVGSVEGLSEPGQMEIRVAMMQDGHGLAPQPKGERWEPVVYPGLISVGDVFGNVTVSVSEPLQFQNVSLDRTGIQRETFKMAENFTRDVILETDLVHQDSKTIEEITNATRRVLYEEARLTHARADAYGAMASAQRGGKMTDGYTGDMAPGMLADLESANAKANIAIEMFKISVKDHPELVAKADAMIAHNDAVTKSMVADAALCGVSLGG